MKKIIALLLAMIMVLALAACAAKTEPAQAETTAETTAPAETTETTETAAPADGFKVAISLAEYNEWNKLYEAVIKEKCDEWGWTYEIFDSKQDASTQIDQVNSIIAQGFNAMTIQAVDNAALAPVVGQAADNGIIVVDHYGFADELGISDKIYKVLFGQKECGILEAAEYVKIGGESGKVAIIAGLTGADNAQQRTAGFEEELAKYPDIEIVATQYCDWDTQKAQAAAEDIITANPDLLAGDMIGMFAPVDDFIRVLGLTVIGTVGEETPFDSARHDCPALIEPGTPVIVATVGYAKGEQIWVKARVKEVI